MATQAFEKLGKQLNVFQSKLELFDGTTNVNDFVSDIQRYCEYIGQTDDCEKLNVLISHLTGEAKDTFRNVKDPEFDSVISALQIRFAPTELALHRVKAELFGTKQTSGETCKQFAIRVQNAARHTDLSELDLVKVVIEGLTTTELRNHIMMAAPTSIDNLIKLPVVADERVYYDCASWDNFSLLTAAVSNLSSQVAQLSKSTKHDAGAESHVTGRNNHWLLYYCMLHVVMFVVYVVCSSWSVCGYFFIVCIPRCTSCTRDNKGFEFEFEFGLQIGFVEVVLPTTHDYSIPVLMWSQNYTLYNKINNSQYVTFTQTYIWHILYGGGGGGGGGS